MLEQWGHQGFVILPELLSHNDLAPAVAARQLGLFGFPPPGHPYWTPDALAGMALRYPGLDLSPWKSASKAA